MAEFKLSASLEGHEDDVRAVSFAGPRAVISASRDGTVRHWQRTSPDSGVPSKATFDGNIAYHGTAFINSCAFLPPSQDYPQGLIVSGGKEALIDVRPPGRPPEQDAERLLIGHQGNVCALDVGVAESGEKTMGMLMSGSWDGSAMIWDVEKGTATVTLEGHQGSVWAVLPYDRKVVITGAADKIIRVWSTSGKLLHNIKGSTDVVRALCRLPSGQSAAQFASAGNDGIIRLWTLEGREVAQLHGHENFVYALATLPNGDLVSSSEDRTVRIWRGNECIQTITHPAISVWSVAACPETGDIVTGSSDRIVRVFSRDAARQADAETRKVFEDAVKSSAIPQQQMPQINKEKLPGPEFLQQKSGTKEGQVQMIREANGNVTAHQWSGAASQWISVGTVVDAAGSSGRKLEYLGKDYDYVFDVDIEDGKPPLKLPYNLSDNPYEAAQKFIANNELPMTYLDQVANFITTNTQGQSIGQDAQPAGSDPWGTQNRYRPGDDTAAPPEPRPQIIPQKDYLYIIAANYTQMFKKITEINSRLSSSAETQSLALSNDQLNFLPSLSKEVESAVNKSTPATSSILTTGVTLAHHIITNWPVPDRIPGLDLYRLLAFASPSIASSETNDFLRTIDASQSLACLAPTSASANTSMLTLRSFANLFAHKPGRTLLAENFSNIWALASAFIPPPSAHVDALSRSSQHAVRVMGTDVSKWRNVHIAAVTVAINYAILSILAAISGDPADMEGVTARTGTLAADLLAFLADPKVVDSETVYRGLVALGTLTYEPKLGVLAAGPEVRAKLGGVLKRIEGNNKEPRMRAVVEEIRTLL